MKHLTADENLTAIAEREWRFRRLHIVRELGAYVPLLPRLPQIDEATQTAKLQFWEDIIDELDSLPHHSLSSGGREDRLVLRQQLDSLVQQQRFKDYQRPFNAFTTFWGDVAAVIREEHYDDDKKYLYVIAIMNDLPRYFEQAKDNMAAGLTRGFSQPTSVLQNCIDTISEITRQHAEDTGYFMPFRELSATVKDHQSLREQALKAIETAVLPAHVALLKFMTDTYRPRATHDIAAKSLPDGMDYYESKVREFTTLDIDIDNIYDIGLEQVDFCREKMLQSVEESGFGKSLSSYLDFLKNSPEFYATTPKELLMHASWVARRAEAKLHLFFNKLPRQRFAIEAVPDSIAPSFPMGTGAPGLYLLNTYNLPARPLYTLPVLTLHEAVPGHCFQMALALENHDRPAFRTKTYSIAYGNAWALYCERRLGLEMGIYETTHEHFGMWSLQALRAVRLVVDIGIHTKSWDFDRAFEFMTSMTGLPKSSLEFEIKRYISWPGQALGYYLGMLAIERAREKATAALGSCFDLREFHDRILALGPVPLTVVEQSVDEMINEKISGL